jgi:hypothetical protein
MAFSTGFRHIPVKDGTIGIRIQKNPDVRFLFNIRCRIAAVAVIACNIEQGMFGIRPLFIITFCKLTQGSSMAFKRAGYIPRQMLKSYLVELLLGLIKCRKFLMTVQA